jgi:hypothetical protein
VVCHEHARRSLARDRVAGLKVFDNREVRAPTAIARTCTRVLTALTIQYLRVGVLKMRGWVARVMKVRHRANVGELRRHNIRYLRVGC